MFQASLHFSAHKMHFVEFPQENCSEPEGSSQKQKQKQKNTTELRSVASLTTVYIMPQGTT